MPRSPEYQTHISEAPLNFRGFWHTISRELGPATLSVNETAASIDLFLTGEGYHREIIRDIVVRSFEINNCQTLDDKIDVNLVLDVLGATAFQLQGCNADDLLDIELLEEVAFLVSSYYPHHIQMPERRFALNRQPGKASIIDLSHSRIHRANRKL